MGGYRSNVARDPGRDKSGSRGHPGPDHELGLKRNLDHQDHVEAIGSRSPGIPDQPPPTAPIGRQIPPPWPARPYWGDRHLVTHRRKTPTGGTDTLHRYQPATGVTDSFGRGGDHRGDRHPGNPWARTTVTGTL